MEEYADQVRSLIVEIEKLHHRNTLSKTVTDDYFEPGMMEYLDQSDGFLDEGTGSIIIRFESRGTRYGDRTEQIEKIQVGDPVILIRERDNRYNPNNFMIQTIKGHDIGNMPAELCNVIAPLYDAERFEINSSEVSFVEPISKRSRHAKQAILFVELKGRLL